MPQIVSGDSDESIWRNINFRKLNRWNGDPPSGPHCLGQVSTANLHTLPLKKEKTRILKIAILLCKFIMGPTAVMDRYDTSRRRCFLFRALDTSTWKDSSEDVRHGNLNQNALFLNYRKKFKKIIIKEENFEHFSGGLLEINGSVWIPRRNLAGLPWQRGGHRHTGHRHFHHPDSQSASWWFFDGFFLGCSSDRSIIQGWNNSLHNNSLHNNDTIATNLVR